MKSYLQFLTTPTVDTPGTTLLLHFDNKRYLIGSVAEGTQRASVQQGARLLKVSDIFITGKTEWSNVGGLIGMILTLADSNSSSASSNNEDVKRKIFAKLKRDSGGEVDEKQLAEQLAQELKNKTRLNIFGAPNLNYLLATARRFVFRKGMPVDIKEFSDSEDTSAQDCPPSWSDTNINVWAMSILPSAGGLTPPSRFNGTVSPRKRSYDELEDAVPATHLSNKEKTAMMSKGVVSEMFDSTWRLDALVESRISEVKLPAALFVKDEVTGKTVKYTGPMPGGPLPVPDIKVLIRRPWPGALVETLPPSEPAQESVCYIFKNHRQRGKFRPQRAKELGVEQGPKWAALSNGKSVQSSKGETISPDMVLEEGKDGGGVAIIDLPSIGYVDALVNRPEWKVPEIMSGLGAFVWMLGPGVAGSPLLRSFITEMKHMRHIVASPENCPNRISLDSAAAATARLRHLDPARYGIPVHNNSTPNSAPSALADVAVNADRGLVLQLEPSIDVQDSQIPTLLDFDKVVSEMSPEVVQAGADARSVIQDSKDELDAWADKLPQKDVEIITLGTGSALPSKYRNVSATLVRVPGWGSLLLDCGENTLGQLKRTHTDEQFAELMQDLKMIWISHMHADHHLGTVSVIRAWYQEVHGATPMPVPTVGNDFNPGLLFHNQKRLAVVSDVPMLHWLHEYSNIDDYGFSRLAPLFITAAHVPSNTPSKLNWFVSPQTTQSKSADARLRHDVDKAHVPASLLDLSDIQAVLVQHCHGARAVSITFPSGFKASYSGDCRPSKAFSQIGKGSTVCIHEATFDDELQGDAEAKNHTTTSEALSVALAMNAKACVLTHFSQRYQKVPVLEYTDNEEAISSYDADADADADANAMVTDEIETSANPDDGMDAPVLDVAAATSESVIQQHDPTKHSVIKLKRGTDMKVCVAFDLMRVKVDEIAQLEKMTPALISLFADEEKDEGKMTGAEAEDGKEKTEKAGKKKGKIGKSRRNN